MNKGKKALSLTELLIVLVVIALLFAAIAPIITKRHVAETHENESIWNYVSGDTDRNSFFDPGSSKWTSSVYVGMVPSSANDNAGKLVIDSNNISYNSETYFSPHMQFRFSQSPQEQGRGINAATLSVTSDSIIFGSNPVSNNYVKSVIYGLSNLTDSFNPNALTVMGSGAMGGVKLNTPNTSQYITAVGHRAGYKYGSASTSSSNSAIYVGSNAGAGTSESEDAPSDNIAIGYDSMSRDGNAGSHNVFIGANTGNGFSDSSSSYNTIIGSAFSRNIASKNTIVGYGVYVSGIPSVSDKAQVNSMTAIGYKACNSLYGANGSKICIGATSGETSNNTPDSFNTDSNEHIFIGGKPKSATSKAFSGRSVLEVHNISSITPSYGNVVLNSNLVVRGNFYPSNNAMSAISRNIFSDTQTAGAEDFYYRCNQDAYQSILTFNNYICKNLVQSNPKSINLLYYKGTNCPVSDGYPNGSGCPNIISSDVRLKTNISENNDGLDKIIQIKPYNYTYKNDPYTQQVGVIAQDLQKVFPNAVSKGKDGFLEIRWEDMFYALVNSIKQLALKIEDVASKISAIKNDILQIGNEQKSIEKQIIVINKRINKLERK